MLGGKAKNYVCFFHEVWPHTLAHVRGDHGHGGHARSDNNRVGGIVEATPIAVLGLMKAKASPKMVEGITKAVSNLAEGPSLLSNVEKRFDPQWWKG